jgi:hypothetical protein
MSKTIRLINCILLVSALAAVSCVGKKSNKEVGIAIEDELPPDGSDTPGAANGLGSYFFYLNMVTVPISALAQIESRTIFNAAGNEITTETISLYQIIEAIPEFAPDAAKFEYEPINFRDVSVFDQGGNSISYADLEKLFFYLGSEDEKLCLGWSEAGHESQSLCLMQKGMLVTHPLVDQFDIKKIAWVNERTDNVPSHLGDTVAIQAVVTTGTDVVVYGGYLKSFLQQEGFGLKVFGDFNASIADQGYDGNLLQDIQLFEGDEIFVEGRITVHEGMIEFVPSSGYHVAVISKNNALPTPRVKTADELAASPYRYAGTLVRVNDLEIIDVNPSNPATDWPEFGQKSKDIVLSQTGSSATFGLQIYQGTGIPGSRKPAAGFDLIGALNLNGDTFNLFPRKIEDVNPTDERLSGTVSVRLPEEDLSVDVDLSTLPAGLQVIEDGGSEIAVVSLATVINSAELVRHPKRSNYKPVAYDDRQPFETSEFDLMKVGVFYQDTPDSPDQPDPMLSTYFWEDAGLSHIFYLRGVNKIDGYRDEEGIVEGDAERGLGITLVINGSRFAVNFDSLPTTTYNGLEAIAISDLISDDVIDRYTMSGSFSKSMIKALYDYRLVSYMGDQEITVRLDDLTDGYLIMDDPPYTEFESYGSTHRIDDLFTVELLRFIEVDEGVSGSTVIYLKDCPTESVDIGDGVFEDVVFFGTVMEEAGINIDQDMYLYDFWLIAADGFTSYWPYKHNHLDDLYFRPDENRGFTVDPDMAAYGSRSSTKAVNEIELHAVPQAAPSIPIQYGGVTIWGSDADSCVGCHSKDDFPVSIDCYSCHATP